MIGDRCPVEIYLASQGVFFGSISSASGMPRSGHCPFASHPYRTERGLQSWRDDEGVRFVDPFD